MNREFDKFAWISAIRDDDQMPYGIKYVLQNIAWTYVLNKGDGTLHTRQTTIADRLRVSVRQVKSAYAEARRLGYFVLAAERQRGRGRSMPDRYLLQMPTIGAGFAPINEGAQLAPIAEIGARNDVNRCTDRQEEVHETTEIGARADAMTSGNDTPKGIKQGIGQGKSRAPTSAGATHTPEAIPDGNSIDADAIDQTSDPEPSRYCVDHMPYGTTLRCPPCGTARIAHENWTQRQQAAMQARRTAAMQARSACTRCDEAGWLLGPDGTPIEPAAKCRSPLKCAHAYVEAVPQ